MSHELINHSSDLKRLQDEGYDVGFRANHLTVSNVPYVNSKQEVHYGTLISELTLADDVTTARPSTHVVYFAGDHPCNRDGSEITGIKHGSAPTQIDKDLIANHSFSNKPSEGYKDYYDKMTRYIEIICNPARSIDPTASAISFPVIECKEEESVFNYRDTASSRAGIYAITRKLEFGRLGIVGLGGTGAYVLDLAAKTPVQEIHLFDGDQYFLHNAFRSPGAPSVEELRRKLKKVEPFREQYSKMRRNIYILTRTSSMLTNVDELRDMDFRCSSASTAAIRRG